MTPYWYFEAGEAFLKTHHVEKKSFHFGGCSPKGANGVNTKGLGWRSETRRNLKLANDGIQFDEDISLQMSGNYPHHIVI